MKKLTTKRIAIFAAIVYFIALVVFHLDYSYDDGYVNGSMKYNLYEESDIIIVGTLLYLLAIGIIIGIVKYIKNVKKPKETTKNTLDVAPSAESVKEEQIQAMPKLEERSTVNDEDSQYIGTGVIGLKNYTDFCQIVAILAIFSGVLCAIYAIANSDYRTFFIMLSIYLILGSIGCFILSALLKALTTITKAAKLYLDINKKEKE